MGFRKHIPNVFTLGNLMLGIIAIVYIVEDVKPMYGAYCLILALVFDFLDGFVARALKTTSEIGKQLDSLADVVSFGVVPSLIAFKFVSPSFHDYGTESNSNIWFFMGFLVFIMAAASACRLARFNLDEGQTYTFKGLPTPANAILWIGLLGAYEQGLWPSLMDSIFTEQPWILCMVVLIMSWLLVSNIEMFSLKMNSANKKSMLWPLVLLISGLIMFAFFKWLALPLIVILYIVISLIKSVAKT